MKQYFITTISAVLLILMAYFAGCKTSAATVENPNANIDRAILLAMDYLSKIHFQQVDLSIMQV